MNQIVAIERKSNGLVELFFQDRHREEKKIPLWLLSDKPLKDSKVLDGQLPLKYYNEFNSTRQVWDAKNTAPKDTNWLHIYDEKDSALIKANLNLFKGIASHKEIPTLSFDIEATTLTHGVNAKVLLISNTFQHGSTIIRKLFSHEDYPNDAKMLEDWARWVTEMDPTNIIGHNIYSYDLPYMDYCAKRGGVAMKLGRDGSPIRFNTWESKFRREQNQFYSYNEAKIYGRNVIDTFFLSIKADVSRKYESYGLKQIIKQEGLEVEGRQHYDASKIGQNYTIPAEWALIKKYAEHDADDALAIYNLMVPAFFFMTQIVPKTFTNLINTASGGQLNQMMIQKYLQQNHSIPLPSPEADFEGALSGSNPGIYKDCFKADVASLYPSLMLTFGIQDVEKDPLGLILKTLKELRTERLENKKKGKTSQYHKDLSEAQKVLINSMYGFLGTPGLNFNAPHCAAAVTRHGRELLQKAMDKATELNLKLVNFDTDSITVSGENTKQILKELNNISPEGIIWEDDGSYNSIVVIATKNYVTRSVDGKVKIKGSSLKATTKEPALKEFLNKGLMSLLENDSQGIFNLYLKYVNEILSPTLDIKRWAFKKTITETLLTSKRANETKIVDALVGQERIQEGDKYYFYYRDDDTVANVDNWKGDHSVKRLLKKLYDTAQIFETVYPTEYLDNLTLKKNQRILKEIEEGKYK